MRLKTGPYRACRASVARLVTTTNVDDSYKESAAPPVRLGIVSKATEGVVARRITGTVGGAGFDLHQTGDLLRVELALFGPGKSLGVLLGGRLLLRNQIGYLGVPE